MRTHKVPNREVYVWQLPVRFFHWINALAIAILCITGYIIGTAPALQIGTAPEFNYWFGIVRFIHFVAAFVFIINFLFRIYWAFAGNSFARWNNYIPLTKKQWRGIYDTIRVDALLATPKPIYDIGHNSLAAFTYFGVFILFLLQTATGLAMYSEESNFFLFQWFSPLIYWLNGFSVVRQVHHALMWLFIIFAIVHIYLVVYHDYVERNGITSSMIGGWKFIPEPVIRDYEKVAQKKKELELLKKAKKIESKEQIVKSTENE